MGDPDTAGFHRIFHLRNPVCDWLVKQFDLALIPVGIAQGVSPAV
jgi:hypothetical protein